MKVRLRHLWEIVSSSYWFVPSLMTIASCGMAILLLYIDRNFLGSDVRIGWLYSGGSEGARNVLSTVAGSVITVAGVVFSITIAAMTQASAQFGPRLLRNFMRDTSNQVVLGTFVATFLYCLLILRTIHGSIDEGLSFVPQASITVAVLLAIASIAVLIYFIHHLSVSLQAPNVIAAVRGDLVRSLNQLLDSQNGRGAASNDPGVSPLPEDFDRDSAPAASQCDGYLQAVDYQSLVRIASQHDLLLRLDCRPGDYLIHGNPLLRASPPPDDAIQQRISRCFIFGDHRTPEQDIEQAIRQLVEIAVRALSPGINDPFTAINCVDALGSSICLLARRGLPGPLHYDQQQRLRLVTRVSTFAGITDSAFNQIRQYGRTSVAVTIRLLETIGACAAQCSSSQQRQPLLQHAQMIYRQSQDPQSIPDPRDRSDAHQAWENVLTALKHPDPATPSTDTLSGLHQ